MDLLLLHCAQVGPRPAPQIWTARQRKWPASPRVAAVNGFPHAQKNGPIHLKFCCGLLSSRKDGLIHLGLQTSASANGPSHLGLWPDQSAAKYRLNCPAKMA